MPDYVRIINFCIIIIIIIMIIIKHLTEAEYKATK